MARRPLAAAIILTVGALALTGCIPMPPAVPVAPPAPTTTAEPAPEPSEPGEPGATDEPGTDGEPAGQEFTVDDGLGDVWTFSVTGLEADPPMESGEPEAGTYFVGILVDGEHLEGSLDFTGCFDILVVGSDGVEYDWADTLGVTAVDDIFYADVEAFTGARAVVQLPEGVDPTQLIFRSVYGHPDVPDSVVDVQ